MIHFVCVSLAIKGQQLVVQKIEICSRNKGVHALRGFFAPPSRAKKLKVAFHQFHPSVLLEEYPKCKILAFIFLLSVAMVTKMAKK